MMRALCATLGSEGARKAQEKVASEERAIDAKSEARLETKGARKCACDLFSDCAKHAGEESDSAQEYHPWA